jgi:hypothetical protein
MPKPSTSSGISVKVPSKAVGKAIETVIEWFKPFTERQGLKADHLRLQREDVLIEIARKARQRLAIEKGGVAPIPAKVLVPLIEAASIEDPNDEYMINLWSNLLTAAAKNLQVEPRYIGILRELTARQAQLLHSVATHKWGEFDGPVHYFLDAAYEGEDWIIRDVMLTAAAKQMKSKSRLTEGARLAVLNEVADHLDRPGCAIIQINDKYNGKPVFLSVGSDFDGQHLDFGILSSLGLCQKICEDVYPTSAWEISSMYYHLTHLGVKFLSCCDPDTFDPKT